MTQAKSKFQVESNTKSHTNLVARMPPAHHPLPNNAGRPCSRTHAAARLSPRACIRIRNNARHFTRHWLDPVPHAARLATREPSCHQTCGADNKGMHRHATVGEEGVRGCHRQWRKVRNCGAARAAVGHGQPELTTLNADDVGVGQS
jgi:hypothetical protein